MMTNSWRTIAPAVIALAFFPTFPVSAQEQAIPNEASAQDSASSIPAHEQPFWDSAQAFVDAYAKRDSAAIGELFTEEAEFYDEFGELTVGRESIVAMFQGVFEGSPAALIDEIRIERIRTIAPTVVVEEGVVFSLETPSGPHHQSRYVALHTKGSDDKWRINTLKDYPRESIGRQEELQQLAWLVGEWINEESDSVVHTRCDWAPDGNFLLREFTVQTLDGRVMNGVQRVGWDPAVKKLRSWTFDSEGGFFSGLWTKHGDQWLLTSAGVNADGAAVSATSVYTIIDDEMVTWQHQSLIVGGDVRSDNDPVTMVRRPPPPMQASN